MPNTTSSAISVSGKDLILIVGGLFLIYKSTKEIYHKMEGEHEDQEHKIGKTTFANIIGQILLLDLVFSVDSIITAVGLANEIWVMYTAVVVSVIVMLIAAGPISNFVNKHPAFKILALSFLLLIGFTLLIEGFDVHIPKGYVYFAMAFAFLVDVIQMKVVGKKSKPVKLKEHFTIDPKLKFKNKLLRIVTRNGMQRDDIIFYAVPNKYVRKYGSLPALRI